MKIAFVTKISMPGKRGVCFAIAQMCQAFSQNRHRVQLIYPDRVIDPSVNKESFWEYFQVEKDSYLIKKIWVINLPKFSILELILGHLRELIIGWTFSINCLVYFIINRPTYIHLFTECKELLLLLRIISFFYNPKIGYEVHVLPQNIYERTLDWFGAPVVNIVITTTQNVADYYKNRVKLVEIMPMGINLENFDYKTSRIKLRQELGLPRNEIVIGYGGRFVTNKMEKGISDLIKATEILNKNDGRYFLCCVGGPEEYVTKYVELSKKVGLKESEFMFKNHVLPKILYQFMRSFDVCVMPFPQNPHFAYIMSPLKMFEYMASKNPIVATDLPSVREVLTHSETALLAKPGDYKDLAKNIDLLMRNKQLGQKLSKAAFSLVSKTHTWRKRQATIIAAVSS